MLFREFYTLDSFYLISVVHSEDIMMLKEMSFYLLSKEDKIVVTNFFFYAVSVMVTEETVHES